MTPTKVTKRQREVLDHLSLREAFTREKASTVCGGDTNVAEKLASNGVINKIYKDRYGDVYWIRSEGEISTGNNIPAGFIVILHRNVTTPSGRSENFFLARATYDGKDVTFRRLLRSWMSALNLKAKDLLSSIPVEIIPADSPVFSGDHVILDAAPGGNQP